MEDLVQAIVDDTDITITTDRHTLTRSAAVPCVPCPPAPAALGGHNVPVQLRVISSARIEDNEFMGEQGIEGTEGIKHTETTTDDLVPGVVTESQNPPDVSSNHGSPRSTVSLVQTSSSLFASSNKRKHVDSSPADPMSCSPERQPSPHVSRPSPVAEGSPSKKSRVEETPASTLQLVSATPLPVRPSKVVALPLPLQIVGSAGSDPSTPGNLASPSSVSSPSGDSHQAVSFGQVGPQDTRSDEQQRCPSPTVLTGADDADAHDPKWPTDILHQAGSVVAYPMVEAASPHPGFGPMPPHLHRPTGRLPPIDTLLDRHLFLSGDLVAGAGHVLSSQDLPHYPAVAVQVHSGGPAVEGHDRVKNKSGLLNWTGVWPLVDNAIQALWKAVQEDKISPEFYRVGTAVYTALKARFTSATPAIRTNEFKILLRWVGVYLDTVFGGIDLQDTADAHNTAPSHAPNDSHLLPPSDRTRPTAADTGGSNDENETSNRSINRDQLVRDMASMLGEEDRRAAREGLDVWVQRLRIRIKLYNIFQSEVASLQSNPTPSISGVTHHEYVIRLMSTWSEHRSSLRPALRLGEVAAHVNAQIGEAGLRLIPVGHTM